MYRSMPGRVHVCPEWRAGSNCFQDYQPSDNWAGGTTGRNWVSCRGDSPWPDCEWTAERPRSSLGAVPPGFWPPPRRQMLPRRYRSWTSDSSCPSPACSRMGTLSTRQRSREKCK